MARSLLLPVRRIGLLVALAAAGGCATGVLMMPTPAQVASAQAMWPEVTPINLEAGRSLCATRCSGCHAVPDPRDYATEAWPSEVQRMAKRAHLDDDQVEGITRYLQTATLPTGSAPQFAAKASP